MLGVIDPDTLECTLETTRHIIPKWNAHWKLQDISYQNGKHIGNYKTYHTKMECTLETTRHIIPKWNAHWKLQDISYQNSRQTNNWCFVYGVMPITCA